jgi:Predicted transcriptional regulator
MTVAEAPATTDEIVDIQRVARSLNLNVATIARMSKRGDFPPSLPIRVHKKLFLRSAVETWWHTVLGGQNGQPFPWAPADTRDDE